MAGFLRHLQTKENIAEDIAAISAITEQGIKCFYFVKLDRLKRQAFFRHIKQKTFKTAAHYGTVLLQGFGTPNDEDFEFLYQQHGIYIDQDDLM